MIRLQVNDRAVTPVDAPWQPLLELLSPAVLNRLEARVAPLLTSLSAMVVFDSVLELRTRLGSIADFSYTTQNSLVDLLVAVAGGEPVRGPLYDPAVGEGHLLARAAVHLPSDELIIGQEINSVALAVARCRFALLDRFADLAPGDTLTSPAHAGGVASTVLCDPPYGGMLPRPLDWSPRWKYGVPAARHPDLAFIPHAQHALKPDGRAFVVTPAGALFNQGNEQRIRRALVNEGLVASITELGPGLAGHTSVRSSCGNSADLACTSLCYSSQPRGRRSADGLVESSGPS